MSAAVLSRAIALSMARSRSGPWARSWAGPWSRSRSVGGAVGVAVGVAGAVVVAIGAGLMRREVDRFVALVVDAVVVGIATVGAVWCRLRGHDWITYPPHIIPHDVRADGVTGALVCMRCHRLDLQVVPREVYR